MGDNEKNFIDNPHLEGTRDEFITKNMKLAYIMGNKYRVYAQNNGIEYDDVMSVAMMGLIKAYDRYDPTKFEGGVTKFSTYAVPMIKGEIFRYIRDANPEGIKVGRLSKELGLKIIKAEKEYKTVEEVMKDFGVSSQYAKEALDYISGKTRATSTEETAYNSGKGDADLTIGEQIGADDDFFSDMMIKEFLNSLDEREQKIVTMLFIKDMTQGETGKALGISQVHVSRILERIRERAEVFRDFGYTSKSLSPVHSIKDMKSPKEKTPKKKGRTRRMKLKEIDEKVVSKELEQTIRLLQETEKSYKEIANETGVSYATVQYYGKEIRTPEQRKKARQSGLKAYKDKIKQEGEIKVEENTVVEEKVEEAVKWEPTSKTRVDVSAGGEGLTISQIQEEFARTMEILTATRASSVMKFRMELKVEA